MISIHILPRYLLFLTSSELMSCNPPKLLALFCHTPLMAVDDLLLDPSFSLKLEVNFLRDLRTHGPLLFWGASCSVIGLDCDEGSGCCSTGYSQDIFAAITFWQTKVYRQQQTILNDSKQFHKNDTRAII